MLSNEQYLKLLKSQIRLDDLDQGSITPLKMAPSAKINPDTGKLELIVSVIDGIFNATTKEFIFEGEKHNLSPITSIKPLGSGAVLFSTFNINGSKLSPRFFWYRAGELVKLRCDTPWANYFSVGKKDFFRSEYRGKYFFSDITDGVIDSKRLMEDLPFYYGLNFLNRAIGVDDGRVSTLQVIPKEQLKNLKTCTTSIEELVSERSLIQEESNRLQMKVSRINNEIAESKLIGKIFGVAK